MTRSRIHGVAVALTAAACVTTSPHSLDPVTATASPVAPDGVETGDLDRRVDPCTDFDAFASGTYREQHPIPPSKARWSRRVAAREGIRDQLREILEEVSSRRDWPAGSVERLLGDHYASCMDEASVEAAGVTPLAPLLAELAGARSAGDVQRAIRRLHDLAIAVPFGLVGGMDYHEPSRFLATVVAGTRGLPGRDHYLKGDARSVDARENYRAHVARLLELGGMPREQAPREADGVLALETRLAEASLDGAAAVDPATTDHVTTFAELQRLTPHFDWARYFDETGLSHGEVDVAEPGFLRQVDRELAETPVATWRSYLTFHLLDSAARWLSRPFVEESFAFQERYLAGATELPPRAVRCVESTEALLGEALGKKYVQRHLPPAAKARLKDMVRTLLAVLEDEVAGLDWMAPDTKKKALEQLATFDVQVGYPDRWRDDSTLPVRRDAFWANVAAARRSQVDEDRRRIGKPTVRELWQVPPSSAAGYIDFQRNQIVVPAGALQPPVFALSSTDAVSYGAIGAVLAHDLTHAIDPLGALLDAQGHPREWWSATDHREFEKRGQCVVDQLEGYFVEPGVHLRGKLVESEAIADLAGVRLAYLALQRSMKSRPVPVVDGFTPDQQLFISWGQLRGEDVRLEAQRQIVKDDIHPVPRFRVIGTLSNLPEFQRAFSCKAAAPMVRSPEARCAVW